MQIRLPLAAALIFGLAIACLDDTATTTNTCTPTDDAGAFQGSLFSLDSSGNLTIFFDAGNGGVDLGPVKLPDGGLGHVYEWPCIAVYDCATPRDASLTFESPNGVSDWSVVAMNFDTGSNCTSAAAEDAGSCCISCMASNPGSLPCGNQCISPAVECTSPQGCACQ